jgi:hypothetical protein
VRESSDRDKRAPRDAARPKTATSRWPSGVKVGAKFVQPLDRQRRAVRGPLDDPSVLWTPGAAMSGQIWPLERAGVTKACDNGVFRFDFQGVKTFHVRRNAEPPTLTTVRSACTRFVKARRGIRVVRSSGARADEAIRLADGSDSIGRVCARHPRCCRRVVMAAESRSRVRRPPIKRMSIHSLMSHATRADISSACCRQPVLAFSR